MFLFEQLLIQIFNTHDIYKLVMTVVRILFKQQLEKWFLLLFQLIYLNNQTNQVFRSGNQRMGKIIDNYNIQSQLGSGVYSTVYKAINMKTKQFVAIKMVKVDKFRELPKLQQGTINQINILSNLEPCEHIIKYYDMLKTVNNFYFVYEFCNGGTLEQLLKKNIRFQQSEALKYFAQIIAGFKVLNKHNIIHRDLKPENILLNDGVIKIADFGFCKVLQNPNEMVQTMLGSPIYMAPEILKGETYTLKADIWSLGVILYRMLFGVCPFQSASIAKLIMNISNEQMQFPDEPKVSSTVIHLLSRMLVKDYKKRADWTEVFSYEVLENKIERRSKDKQQFHLYKNNSVIMHTSTTITQKDTSSFGYESLHRLNTDSSTLVKEIQSLNRNSCHININTETQLKSQTNKIKLKSRPSLKEDSNQIFTSFKNGKSNTTTNITNSVKGQFGAMKQPSIENLMLSSGSLGNSPVSQTAPNFGYQSNSVSVFGLNKSGIRDKNGGSRIDSYTKNHQKYIDLIGLCLQVSKYESENGYVLAYIIAKGLQKQWCQALQSSKKECLKDYQNIEAQQIYGIIMEQLQFLKMVLEMYEKQITIYSLEGLESNKRAVLKQFVNSLKLTSMEQLVMASRIVDYIDQSLLIRKQTYAKLSKEQLTRQVKNKFKNS